MAAIPKTHRRVVLAHHAPGKPAESDFRLEEANPRHGEVLVKVLAAALGGLDGLVFTAGFGEHAAATRAEVAVGCGWLGLKLDATRNTLGSVGSAQTARRCRPGSCRPTRSA
jgi:acetate kinase